MLNRTIVQLLTIAGTAALMAGCEEHALSQSAVAENAQSASQEATKSEPAAPGFVDIADQSGLSFIHDTGASGEYFFPEISGSGCGFFDYDNDGDLDVYAVQAFPLADIADDLDRWTIPEDESSDAGRNRLFRNDMTINADGTRTMRFVDVTTEAGVGDRGYGQGCAAGDIDNDGDLDLLVTNYGPNALFRNNGDGTFTDITPGYMRDDTRWSTSASFFDYDNDGRLDLFIANYVDFHRQENKQCHSASGQRDYCGPSAYNPVRDVLYQNVGDGEFVDVTAQAGVDRAFGSGLGVVAADFNRDGWMDVYVANDGNANQLWMNNGDGTFSDQSLLGGAAYNANGMPEAGMGVSAADFDNDGDEDIFLAHLLGETNTLLVNDGEAFFSDRTDPMALGAVSKQMTGFGALFFDAENDGDLDLFVANGEVRVLANRGPDDHPYALPNQLFVNTGPPAWRFIEASKQAGPDVTMRLTSRGAAFGDVDNDGDTDILVANSDGPLQLLRNDSADANTSISLSAVDDSGHDVFGAIVMVRDVRGAWRERRVGTDGSYLAINDPRVIFGLGNEAPESIDALVRWPGVPTRWAHFADLVPNGHHILQRGQGQPAQPPQRQQLAGAVSSEDGADAHTTGQNSGELPAIPQPQIAHLEPFVQRQFDAAGKVVHAQPDDPQANGRWGMHLHAHEMYALAEQAYRRAVHFAGDDPQQASQWRYLRAVTLIELGEPSEAARELDEVLQQQPQSVPALSQRARADHARQRPAEAAVFIRRALEVSPDDPHLHTQLAQVLLDTDDAAGAADHAGRALTVAPNYALAHYVLGLAQREFGQLDQAAVSLELAEGLDGQAPPINDPLLASVDALRVSSIQLLRDGIALLERGQPERARDLLERAIEINPSLVEAHSQLGTALLLMGRIDEAEQRLRHAVELDPDFVDAMYNLGVIAHQRGEIAQAAEWFGRVVEIRPTHFEAQFGLGTDAAALAEHDRAVAALEAAVLLRPDETRPYRQLAEVHAGAGDIATAISVLEAGVERLPEAPAILDRLAWFLAVAPAPHRNPQRAVDLATRACELTAYQIPRAIDTLAVALGAAGDFTTARQRAQEARQKAQDLGNQSLVQEIEGHLRQLEAGEPIELD